MNEGDKKEKEFRPGFVGVLSGLANWAGDMLLYPLDTLSTRLKANKYTKHATLPFIKISLQRDKFKIYRGFLLTFPYSFIPTVVYVYLYEQGLKLSNQIINLYYDKIQLKIASAFFVSCFAEAVSMLFYLPVDTVRTRIQMNTPEYPYTSFRQGLADINKKEGFFRLYRASRIYLACKVFYVSIQFELFEIFRYYFGPSTFLLLCNTVLSTTIATTLLNPLEVIITRYAVIDTSKKKLVFREIVSRMYSREGFAGFYKGYVTELITHNLYALFWIPIYQLSRNYYGIEILE